MAKSYAQITGWAFVLLHEPNREPTAHVVGYIVRHGRLVRQMGEPYIGSPLRDIDLERRQVLSRRGKVIEMMRKAEAQWNADDGATWERVEAASLPAPR